MLRVRLLGSASVISDRFGRRSGLGLGSFLCFLSSVLISQSASTSLLMLSRLVNGFGAGLLCSIGPVYLAESVPPAYRGGCLSALGLLWGLGQIVAVGAALLLGERWRWMLGLGGVPAAMQLVALWTYVPESPRWLFQHSLELPALSAMRRFYHGSDSLIEQYLDPEVSGIKSEISLLSDFQPSSQLTEIWTNYKKTLGVVCGFMACFSAGGIAAVSLYAAQIMEAAGFQIGDGPLVSVMLLFVVGIAGTLVAIRIIDRVERRCILLSTLPIQAACTLLMSLGMYLGAQSPMPEVARWLCLFSLLGYLIALNLGSGPMMGILAPELFPVRTLYSSIYVASPAASVTPSTGCAAHWSASCSWAAWRSLGAALVCGSLPA